MNNKMRNIGAGILGIMCLLGAQTLAAQGDSGEPDAIYLALKARDGKLATVLLESGTELTGKVSELSESSVRLQQLSGRDFYDAVIDLNRVESVIMRVRDK